MDTPTYDDDVARLALAHPTLFEQRMPLDSDLANGWYEQVDNLCADIERELGPELSRRLEVRQIKEKFRTLRFYSALNGRGDLYVDSIGPGGVKTAVVEPDVNDAEPQAIVEARKRVRELVETARDASSSICQKCGAPGSLRQLSWVQTLCDDHLADAKERTARRDKEL